MIGKDNKLPWHLPSDLKHFKKVTMGKPIIMGRKTFESIGKPLPGRMNIVVTRNPEWRAKGVEVAHSLEEAVGLASLEGLEVMVIGGEELYRRALPIVDRIYLTEVDIEVEGDAQFPLLGAGWKTIDNEIHSRDDANRYDYSFQTLERCDRGSIKLGLH